MTAELFRNARNKIARAKTHFEGLQLEMQRFFDSKPYRIVQEHDLETEEFILVYYPEAPIPEDWPVVISDIFSNLRSSLDLAVYELTVREQGSPLDKTEFPIFDDPDRFAGRTKNNTGPARLSGLWRIRGLRQKTRDIIEQLQPYHWKDPEHPSTLAILNEMGNFGKHNDLHLCRMGAIALNNSVIRDMPNVVRWGLENIGGSLDERTVIARLKLAAGLDDKVYMDADVSLEIVFDESCCSFFKVKQNVVKLLEGLINGTEKVFHYLETSLDS